jgi:AcrR family transcriptional regulator
VAQGQSASSAPTRAVRTDGLRRRQAILREAVALSTVDGLEGLSIGNLAKALAMSKSGLYAHFGSKEELQLATVAEAARIFRLEVIEPARAAPSGVAQLVAVCDAFVEHLRRRTLPGGCFFAGAVVEVGSRPGPVKEAVAAFQHSLVQLIGEFAGAAIAGGQLPQTEDPAQLAFELNGIILATNAGFILSGDEAVLDLARRVVRRRLGVGAVGAMPLSE